MFPTAASQEGKEYFYLSPSLGVGWHKVLPYGRTGKSSFTNNEALHPCDVTTIRTTLCDMSKQESWCLSDSNIGQSDKTAYQPRLFYE